MMIIIMILVRTVWTSGTLRQRIPRSSCTPPCQRPSLQCSCCPEENNDDHHDHHDHHDHDDDDEDEKDEVVASPLEKFNIQHKWPWCQKQIERDMSMQYRRRFSTKYSLDDTVLTFKTLLMLIEILLTNTFFLPRCPCCLMSIPEAPAGILGYISKLIENILIA